MNINKSDYANKDKQAPTGAGAKQSEDGTPAHFPPLSLSELAALLHTCGILPSGQEGNRGDGGER